MCMSMPRIFYYCTYYRVNFALCGAGTKLCLHRKITSARMQFWEQQGTFLKRVSSQRNLHYYSAFHLYLGFYLSLQACVESCVHVDSALWTSNVPDHLSASSWGNWSPRIRIRLLLQLQLTRHLCIPHLLLLQQRG
jgi:hypothetical protein